jgi:hypothetical protein
MYKWSIIPMTGPNPVYIHTHTRDNTKNMYTLKLLLTVVTAETVGLVLRNKFYMPLSKKAAAAYELPSINSTLLLKRCDPN